MVLVLTLLVFFPLKTILGVPAGTVLTGAGGDCLLEPLCLGATLALEAEEEEEEEAEDLVAWGIFTLVFLVGLVVLVVLVVLLGFLVAYPAVTLTTLMGPIGELVVALIKM